MSSFLCGLAVLIALASPAIRKTDRDDVNISILHPSYPCVRNAPFTVAYSVYGLRNFTGAD
jgi:hypothetical protein